MTISASPETEAHSPVELRKAMLILGSFFRSSVFPDSVLVWKRRSTPPPSYRWTQWSALVFVFRTQSRSRDSPQLPTFAANAMHRDVRSPLLSILVVIIPNLHDSMNLTKSSTFSFNSGSCLFVAVYGSAGLSAGTESVLLNSF